MPIPIENNSWDYVQGLIEKEINSAFKLRIKMSYRPLPDYLTIKDSSINGLGLFTTEKIKTNTLIGVTHHPNERSEDGYIRTPLGGFGNHSEDPNCNKILMEDGSFWIGASRDIEVGEELTWTYTLYSIENETKI